MNPVQKCSKEDGETLIPFAHEMTLLLFLAVVTIDFQAQNYNVKTNKYWKDIISLWW